MRAATFVWRLGPGHYGAIVAKLARFEVAVAPDY
jgi:hypothetical protein